MTTITPLVLPIVNTGCMYAIKRDQDGVFLLCSTCNHVERVKDFDGRLGSQRTQAAQAMNTHIQTHRDATSLHLRSMAMAMER